MLFQIITHTPLWVFGLFCILLFLGIVQTKERVVGFKRILLVAIFILTLSFYGTVSAFGLQLQPILFWTLGLGLVILLSSFLSKPNKIVFLKDRNSFRVSGSWFPMFLIMSIFFLKYVVGVLLAKGDPIIGDEIFIAIINLLYGLFGGLFFWRNIIILKSKNNKYNNDKK